LSITAALVFGVAGSAGASTSSALHHGCLTAAAVYTRRSGATGSQVAAAFPKKPVDSRLRKILTAVRQDTTQAPALAALGAWCTAHFPRDQTIRRARFVFVPPTTTTTTPPTTTVPKVFVYDGNGDDVIPIAKPATSGNIVSLTYSGDGNFIVTGLDAQQQRVDGLANEIGAFTGTVPLDFLESEHTAYFQIQSSGPWHIEIKPVTTAPRFSATIEGTGDSVVIYDGKSGIAAFTHDGSSNFIVTSYTTVRNGLINVIGPYTGRVPMPAGPNILAIQADGHWTISVT
jgi:hypothetical protein